MNNDLKQFSEERLKKMIFLEGLGCAVYKANEVAALARIALSVKQAKPVAYLYHYSTSDGQQQHLSVNEMDISQESVIKNKVEMKPLYTTPQPAHTERGIPSVIPKVPHNGVMAYKKDGSIYSTNYARGWNDCVQSMLAAAPKPESE